MKYINVVIDNKSEQTDALYTYKADDETGIGAKLTVPFARFKKPVDAFCVETDVTTDYDDAKIKEICEYDPDRSLSPEMVDTAMWVRKRYGVKYYDALKLFTVPGKRERRDKNERNFDGNPRDFALTEEQQSISDTINKAVSEGRAESFLLKGVTNSGKTEVYMEAVQTALDMGRTAVVLLPEIALASKVCERFSRRFGAGNVAVLHSKLSTAARLEEWLRIRRGEARIVVGARTAVFAPLDNIGVIVIDEEHESTFKSDHNPKYETVDIAYRRALYYGAVLIMGSATPSVVSYNRAEKGMYRLLEMNSRIGSSIMPELHPVDMRAEARSGNMSVLSRELIHQISDTMSRREQTILFLNRRGFSTGVLCPDCGYKMTCPECGITLTYHKSVNAAVCHYCGRRYPVSNTCPECGSKFIRYVGAGTEKVEEYVRKLWPEASVERFDLDTAVSGGETGRIIDDFQNGKTDILVGTQILAKGLDFRNVGLVGIINADVSLNIPDYRSYERTFQLITQVSGRAGRSGGRSSVIIQTYEPDNEVIGYAAAGDYKKFYESELIHRNIMNYPPFSDIISVSVVEKKGKTAGDEDPASSEWEDAANVGSDAMKYAEAFIEMLKGLKGAPENAVILKPRKEKRTIDGKNRVVFVIKAPPGSRNGYISAYMAFREKMIRNNAGCYIEIDVNPYGIT